MMAAVRILVWLMVMLFLGRDHLVGWVDLWIFTIVLLAEELNTHRINRLYRSMGMRKR